VGFCVGRSCLVLCRQPCCGAHIIEATVGDASGVAFQGVLVAVEYSSAVALGVLLGYRRGIPDFLFQYDDVLTQDSPAWRALRGYRGLLGQHHPACQD
jgi:hypothetical protein